MHHEALAGVDAESNAIPDGVVNTHQLYIEATG